MPFTGPGWKGTLPAGVNEIQIADERTFGHAQQTTGQLLISSGFNPIAATTPAMMARLMSFPANQFLLRQKGGRPYYVYADPTACTCAYVGSVAAMDKYRASFGALPADTLSSGGFTRSGAEYDQQHGE